MEKLRNSGYDDADVPLFSEEVRTPLCFKCEKLRNRLDSKVNQITSLMVKKRELLEEVKKQRDFEKEKLDTLQKEAMNADNSQSSSISEDDINV